MDGKYTIQIFRTSDEPIQGDITEYNDLTEEQFWLLVKIVDSSAHYGWM